MQHASDDENEAIETLFEEYLLPWCGTFLGKVEAHADLPFINKNEVEVNELGTVVTDKYNLLTSIDGVFAGGDFGHGPDTAISAIADGKKAACSLSASGTASPGTASC